ncbi:MAG: hypothetical protein JW820_12745 [Spirochaetales bacterium]|nr:hypothetical protein [Spirochaetales bacterium]
MKKQTRCFLLLAALATAAGPPVRAAEIVKAAGRGDGWEEFRLEHLEPRPGRWNTLDLVLPDNQYPPTAATDLLLHFDTASSLSVGSVDRSGHYRLTEARANLSARVTAMGEGAAAFSGPDRGLRLQGLPGALFAAGSLWGDFSIEFWLYPALLADGEQVLSWAGSGWKDGNAVPQRLACTVEDRRLRWSFDNLFARPGGTPGGFSLQGLTPMIPRTWHHHLVRYDVTRGLLEYLVDGVPEAVIHTTESGGEQGSVFVPAVGEARSGELCLGPDLVGFLDELRISRAFVEQPALVRYAGRTGVATSGPMDLGYTGTRVKRIDAVYDTPSDSAVYFSYRLSDQADPGEGEEPWRHFRPGQELADARGRYLEVRVELLPDGGRSNTPRVSEVRVVYEQDLPPPPPSGLYAAPEEGAVRLHWNTVNEADVRGYLVFYGDEPGNYHGTDSDLGPSPIRVEGNVSEFRITGLRNRKLYYFSVVAYDATVPPHRSPFSKETSARPAEIHAAGLPGGEALP